ncbi:hypothetical protein V6R21_07710 [Limibacter armeniacum]|uniref:hypothetical protein n=1 Tax=Limibacter armeniacum TaxID=466084 RepID=UPI002FE517A7
MGKNLIEHKQMLANMSDHGTLRDRIMASYLDPDMVSLTEREESVRMRWEQVNALLLKGHSKEQVSIKVSKLYGISRRMAYNDIRNAMSMYGDVTKSTRDGERAILKELSMRVYRKAWKDGDLKSANVALKNYYLFAGLDKDETDMPNAETIEPHEFVFKLPTSDKGKQLTIDITDIQKLPTEMQEKLINAVEDETITEEMLDEMLDKAEKEHEQ